MFWRTQMGMMKELVRGPIKCCETLANAILLQTRAEMLSYNSNFEPVELYEQRRANCDDLGGKSQVRFLGAPRTHTDKEVLRGYLRVVLNEISIIADGSWEPDDYGREDLVINEYAKVRIGPSTSLTVDWNAEHRKTADYFMYYNMSREDRSVFNMDS